MATCGKADTMTEALIINAIRSPVATAHKGSLIHTGPKNRRARFSLPRSKSEPCGRCR